MKVVLLAGGLGTRFAEETVYRPKPLIEVGGRPIIWHIMMHYAAFGLNEFVIALGYKGEQIKAFFAQELALMGNVRVDFCNQRVDRSEGLLTPQSNWVVDLVETGPETPTGGRLKRLGPYLQDETFMLTFSDGVSNVNLDELLSFHKSHGRLATVTTVRPPGRFGRIEFDGQMVSSFQEKPMAGESWISGGFFVLEPGVLDYLTDGSDLSRDCLSNLAADGQLAAYKHDSFWQCMDTIQEKSYLEALWQTDEAPWKTW